MDVILLERIAKLGQMGDVVTVKPGFARNFLLPQGKALRANAANRELFESQKADLEARNLERKAEAEKIKDKLDGNTYIVIRSAGQTGQLYGSVTTRDIAATLDENGFKVSRNQINLPVPIKVIGVHELTVSLHPEVEATISMNVARSEDEAERQAAGEDLTGRDGQFELEVSEDEEDAIDLSEVFENPEEAEQLEETLAEEAAEDEVADTPQGEVVADEDASKETGEEETK